MDALIGADRLCWTDIQRGLIWKFLLILKMTVCCVSLLNILTNEQKGAIIHESAETCGLNLLPVLCCKTPLLVIGPENLVKRLKADSKYFFTLNCQQSPVICVL